jgi:carbonic anhydrase
MLQNILATLFIILTVGLVPTMCQQTISSEDALSLLKGGNERFVSGHIQNKNFSMERPRLAGGQHPYAIILACADSRVPPELIFDESLGRLFTIRVAGNVADPVVLGSIEYAVEHLHAKLLIILGHEECGAVKATLTGAHVPPNIEAIVKRILPAADKVRAQRLDEKAMVSTAIRENVRYQMQMAMFDSQIITESVEHQKLKVVGGIYNLKTGRVEIIPMNESARTHQHEVNHNDHSAVNTHTNGEDHSHATSNAHATPHSNSYQPINQHSSSSHYAKPSPTPHHTRKPSRPHTSHSTPTKHRSTNHTSKSHSASTSEHNQQTEPKKKLTPSSTH